MVSWETKPHSGHASLPVWAWHLCLRSDVRCLYTRLLLLHPCWSASDVSLPSPPLSPLPTRMQEKKKDWQTKLGHKTRERGTTTTKINWQHVYNGVSDFWHSTALQWLYPVPGWVDGELRDQTTLWAHQSSGVSATPVLVDTTRWL